MTNKVFQKTVARVLVSSMLGFAKETESIPRKLVGPKNKMKHLHKKLKISSSLLFWEQFQLKY